MRSVSLVVAAFVATGWAALRLSAPVAVAATASTTTTTTTTTLPALECERRTARDLAALADAIGACQRRAVHRAFRGKRVTEAACEARLAAAYDRATRRLAKAGCPTCLPPNRPVVRASIEQLTELIAGKAYCGSGPRVTPEHPATVPLDRRSLHCADVAAEQGRKLARKLGVCGVNAAVGQSTSGLAGCVTAAQGRYDAAIARIAGCVPCQDPAAVRLSAAATLLAVGPSVFCSCITAVPPLCDDGNPCTVDVCDPAKGCMHSLAADGTACPDKDMCNGTETCKAGVCKPGTPLNCRDANLCTDDACDAAVGCTHTNNSNACDDGNACTIDDVCANGACVPGAPLSCNDGNPCTVDTCASQVGCIHTPIAGCP